MIIIIIVTAIKSQLFHFKNICGDRLTFSASLSFPMKQLTTYALLNLYVQNGNYK